MLIRTLSIINIVLLLGSVVWFYFLEFIENINQLRIGFYLIILNMVLIFVLSNQKQKLSSQRLSPEQSASLRSSTLGS